VRKFITCLSLTILSFFLFSNEMIDGATQEIYPFDDQQKEMRFNSLIQDYRCPKCQSSNLAGSNAPIAKDLKLEIYKLIKKNKSDQEITNFLTQRYGDFILYKPPFNSLTYILWVGPFILLCFILLFVGWFVASKKPSTSEKFLDSE
jgi:cytochrome c-type biogenesis protein CcmH